MVVAVRGHKDEVVDGEGNNEDIVYMGSEPSDVVVDDIALGEVGVVAAGASTWRAQLVVDEVVVDEAVVVVVDRWHKVIGGEEEGGVVVEVVFVADDEVEFVADDEDSNGDNNEDNNVVPAEVPEVVVEVEVGVVDRGRLDPSCS